MFKFTTIENPRTYAMLTRLSDRDLPTKDQVLDMITSCMYAHDEESSLTEGAVDGLVEFYRGLDQIAVEDEDKEPERMVDGSTAETIMMEAYAYGLAIGIRQSYKAAREAVMSGNSGWWWPESLTFSDHDSIPVSLCERYGLDLGYRHGSSSRQLAEELQALSKVEVVINE